MTEPCNCQTGAQLQKPPSNFNRPGLDALVYRIGTYSSFFENMKSRLSAFDVEGLTTREPDDPAIALLDAWAIVADVLTFYQERIANEGYLRTAIERRSVLELARLVGSSLRPGVSATVPLAYELEQNSASTIPAGSRTQSLPVQGQLPQSFETLHDLPAQGVWNDLTPRLTRPQIVTPGSSTIYVTGITPNLKAGDPLLTVTSAPVLRIIAAADVQSQQNRTKLIMTAAAYPEAGPRLKSFVDLVLPLAKPPAAHPANALQLQRSVSQSFAPNSDTPPSILNSFHPEVRAQLYTAWKNAEVAPPVPGEVHAFRVKAAPFGNNAPRKPIKDEKGLVIGTEEWPLVDAVAIDIVVSVRAREEFSHVPEAFVKIALGQVSASATFPLSATSSPIQVGIWTVELSFPADVIQFHFPEPLQRTFKIQSETRQFWLSVGSSAQVIDVIVDRDRPIRVPFGQTVSSSSIGHRIRISTVNGIAISDESAIAPDSLNVIALDSVYDHIIQGSWVAITRPGRKEVITKVTGVQRVSLARYLMSGRVTQLTLEDRWLDSQDLVLSAVRNATVLAQSERLALAEEPITEDIAGDEIELGDLYANLPAGRWLIVEGERTDLPGGASGVTGAELVMLAGVEQKTQPAPGSGEGAAATVRPGDRAHSFLSLAGKLGYTYKRETVKIHGNVVRATHGETRKEVLGGGDGSQAMQKFTLHQGPIAHLPASTQSGTQSTLEVRCNNIAWTQMTSLAEAGPSDRCYMTRTDDAGKTTIIFGDGIHGMRLPTGRENITAVYRAGLGSVGNVPAKAISQLVSRPFGVKAVLSPLGATGGVDRDGRDQGKANTPLAAAATDRLVAVQDYADYARTFAGIGKASAILLSMGRQQIVYVSVAGADAVSIDRNSDAHSNLQQALQQACDPLLSVEVDTCEIMLLVIAASVHVLPDSTWADVAPRIRSELLDAFGFVRRDLGQSIAVSEVTSAIQLVDGVDYVVVTSFDSITQSDTKTAAVLNAKLDAIRRRGTVTPRIDVRPAGLDPTTMLLYPAQVAFLSSDVPDTLLLVEISS